MIRYIHSFYGDYRDPPCPYTDGYGPDDEEALYEEEVDRWIDGRMESE